MYLHVEDTDPTFVTDSIKDSFIIVFIVLHDLVSSSDDAETAS